MKIPLKQFFIEKKTYLIDEMRKINRFIDESWLDYRYFYLEMDFRFKGNCIKKIFHGHTSYKLLTILISFSLKLPTFAPLIINRVAYPKINLYAC